MHIPQSELAARITEARILVEEGAIYSHYKQPDQHYQVTGLGVTEADDSVCVMYTAQYGDERITFVRPLESWLGKITLDSGAIVPRFSKVVSADTSGSSEHGQ